MYPRTLLISIGLAAFIGSLVVFAPARALIALLPDTSPLRAAQVSGGVYAGQLQTAAASPATWRWQLQPAWLLTLGLGGTWQVEHQDFRGSGRFVVRPWRYSISVDQGELSAARVANLLGGAGVGIDEPLLMQPLVVSGWLGSGMDDASGMLAWGPGDISLRNRPAPIALPALKGAVQTADGMVSLTVAGAATPDLTLATATLDLDSRELHLVVLARAASQLGVASDRPRPPDTPVFELRQPLR